MFREANAIARQFTWPVILSRKAVTGGCSASIGSFVVINDEGWIVTANHIVEQWTALAAADVKERAREASAAAIRANGALSNKERSTQLATLGKPDKDGTVRAAAMWGRGDTKIKGNNFHCLPTIDLAVAQLDPFDPAWVKRYPEFKDPTKDYEPGQSLCKLGFPFNTIAPKYDEATGFELAGPFPVFPIEGILTRFVDVQVPNAGPPPFPMKWIETSSPGLKGQSGGPTFDTKGTIWGIQARTLPLPLGFKTATVPEQYLNVGLGVHAETLIAFFNLQGIKFQMSAY